jgi:PAS domain S-box-containing protein
MRESEDPIHILHVDDDPDFADMAATFVEREDDRFVVETASSAGEALDRIAENEFDCVVSDYEMPGRDGIEFLEAVRELCSDLPFILFTGKGSEEVASDAISAGVTDYLQKEVGADQYALLANRIRNAVSKYRTERALDETRDRVEFALEVTDSIVFELDLDTGIETRHGPFEQLFGIEPGEVPSSAEFYDRCVHPEDRDALESLQGSEALAERDGTVHHEFRTHPDRGEVRWIATAIYAETGPDGDPSRLIGIDTDVTDRKERERELREKSKLLDAIFEHVPTHLYVMDEQARLLRVSEFYVDDPEARIGKTDREIAPGEFGEEAHADNMRVIETGEPLIDKEEYLSSRDRWAITSKIPWYDEEGDVAGLIGVTHDITRRKEYEQALESQNERLEEFARVVSHDLRNPLNIAEGRVTLAREECESEHLADALDALDRSQTLIDDLLTLAREGDELGDLEAVPLAELVADCWEIVETADARLVTDTERTIRADRSRLRQLLENLIRNAVEHADESVTVTVGDLDDGFYVADDGPGVREGDREQVFEPGYSTAEDGTGFGLNIVEEIADAHGWTIELGESKSGGARFEITGVDRPG